MHLLFREEDKALTQRRQTSTHKKREGREREVRSRGILAEVTAHRLAVATYRAPEEHRTWGGHLGFHCNARDNLKYPSMSWWFEAFQLGKTLICPIFQDNKVKKPQTQQQQQQQTHMLWYQMDTHQEQQWGRSLYQHGVSDSVCKWTSRRRGCCLCSGVVPWGTEPSHSWWQHDPDLPSQSDSFILTLPRSFLYPGLVSHPIPLFSLVTASCPQHCSLLAFSIWPQSTCLPSALRLRFLPLLSIPPNIHFLLPVSLVQLLVHSSTSFLRLSTSAASDCVSPLPVWSSHSPSNLPQ